VTDDPATGPAPGPAPVTDDPATGPATLGEGRPGLLRSSVVVAAGTGLSRLTGLVRIVAIAYALGTSPLADAYNLANNTPNIIYDLILGGVISATLVPLIVDRLEHDDEEAVDAIGTIVSLALVALTLVAVALSPLLIRLYSLDVAADRREEQIAVAVPLLLLFMPQVLFYGLTALWTALLNARRSFAAPAFAPVLNNVVVICLFVGLARVSGDDLTIGSVQDDPILLLVLGAGTTAGIVAMTLVLLPAMRRAGVRLRWRPEWRNPALRTLVRLSGWTLGYVVTNQLLLLVLLTLMNGTGEGAVSAYTYAWLFFQLPYGLFAVSIMTTFTPELSTYASRLDLSAYRDRFAQGLRAVLLVMVPTVAGYLVLATPIVSVLLERGEFGATSVDSTVTVLVWLAAALPGYTVFLYTMRGFTAFRDTRTPFLLNLGESILNAALAVALVGPFGLAGVIASYAIGYSIGAVVALVVLRRRVHGLGGRSTGASVARDVVAAAAMALVLVAVVRLVDVGGTAETVVQVLAGVTLGALVYLAVLALLRSEDLQPVRALARRRRSGGARPDDDGMP
jgi:putative peptidoglycan lipid II flippase